MPFQSMTCVVRGKEFESLNSCLDQEVVLYGYLGRRADLNKKLSFVQLLDRELRHSIQIVSSLNEDATGDADSTHSTLKRLNENTPVCIRGKVKKREGGTKSSRDTVERITGVELELRHIQPLNNFPDDLAALCKNEVPPAELRHLQIRTDPGLRDALRFRSRLAGLCRAALQTQEFVEIETPVLFKSTPEGAREFLVPTRQKRMAYALPQSPQQYKQILMASGIAKYYQIARCFRDEDLRADRQPEFTQVRSGFLDLEMAFAAGEDVMRVIERLVGILWRDLLNVEIPHVFPRLPYEEAMSKYGSDKPDRRIGMQITRIDYMLPVDLISKIGPLADPAVDVLKLRIADRPQETKKFVRAFMESKEAADAGILNNPDGQPGIFIYDSRKPLNGLQPFGFEAAEQVEELLDLADGDLVVIQARKKEPFSGGSTALGRMRLALHREAVARGLVDAPNDFDFLWVTEFPMFGPNSDEEGQGGSAGFSSTHHPFTAPRSVTDLDLLATDPLAAKSEHYDLVVNGVELGGGSRRIHDPAFQEFILRDVLKMSEERLGDFKHLLEVLRAGCPPHAGIALGFDRLTAVMLGKSSIKDVIAFPKNNRGEDPLVKSPGEMTEAQLETYHLKMRD
ncbi:hypothetical protein NA57DRAFT_63592 [Rhizodiscina lignyota]|uniref:Aminoacyl-transfer RNA synthetases class-II family profile domain-containing protein n=1 Tax=Rhizodiscina lignyota TaxID=1504668 RepID=A0A9P4IKF1_9PEZI|nr:hypothetical protein NA57DRAFT_63592 [Rhizodiscina lignyota]